MRAHSPAVATRARAAAAHVLHVSACTHTHMNTHTHARTRARHAHAHGTRSEETVDFAAGDLFVVRYAPVAGLVRDKWVALI